MGKIFLNNLFDITRPFIDGIIDFCGSDGRLSDAHFSQALDEFDVSENDAMQLMLDSKDYEFFRLGDGWNIQAR